MRDLVPKRLMGAALVALSLAYLWLFVPRQWIPHDEGMIGQSAEWVRANGVPHVDYEEPYTGGLTYLHAAVFNLVGINLLYLRWLLFAGAALAQVLTYLILRRYLEPIGAAFGTWVALGWSFPNYFASLPSWWVLVCALGCVWAFTRYVETGLLYYVAIGGLAAGVSILIKQTGLYVLVALIMALLFGAGRREQETAVWRPGRLLCASAAVAALGLAVMILRSRPGLAELLYLLLPIAACSALLLTVDGRPGMLPAPATAIATAAVPLVGFIAPYIVHHQLGALVNGLFILPQKRLQFASMGMPPVRWMLAGIPLLTIVVPFPQLVRAPALRRLAPVALWLVAVGLPVAALYRFGSYQLIWQSARGFAALLPVAACWLLFSGRIQDAKQRWMLFGFISMLAWASLVQFPFSAPIYFCYVTPLAVIAAVATAGSAGVLGRPAVVAVAGLLLLFAVLSMNRGYVYNLGIEHDTSYVLDVPLNFPRAGLRVSADDAVTYHRVVALVGSHLGDGRLVCGPDCPEVYFLTGRFSPSGTLFDFFAADSSVKGGLNDIAAWTGATVVVLNHRPGFSPPPSSELVDGIRAQFPETAVAGPFEVRWR